MVPGNPFRSVPKDVLSWVEFALAAPVVFWAGWPLLVRGALSIKHRHLNMFTLIALGVIFCLRVQRLRARVSGCASPLDEPRTLVSALFRIRGGHHVPRAPRTSARTSSETGFVERRPRFARTRAEDGEANRWGGQRE
ncbi:MAG: hypothetical protein QM784_30660 [Polyangiaceae bacterium]